MQKRSMLKPLQAMLCGHALGRKKGIGRTQGTADEGDAMGLCVYWSRGSALWVTALVVSLSGALGASTAAASPRAMAGLSFGGGPVGSMAGVTLANAFSEDEAKAMLQAEGFVVIDTRRTWLGRIVITAEGKAGTREIVLHPFDGQVLRDVIVAPAVEPAPEVAVAPSPAPEIAPEVAAVAEPDATAVPDSTADVLPKGTEGPELLPEPAP
jgi:hypothetical protein